VAIDPALATWADYLKRRHRQAILHLRRAFLRHLLAVAGHQGSVDDIRHHVPAEVSPNVLGVVARGPIRRFLADMGYRSSTNKHSHARPIKVWRLIEPKQADQWLAAHTEEADDASLRDTPRPNDASGAGAVHHDPALAGGG